MTDEAQMAGEEGHRPRESGFMAERMEEMIHHCSEIMKSRMRAICGAPKDAAADKSGEPPCSCG